MVYGASIIFGCQIELWTNNVQTQLSRSVLLKDDTRLHGLWSDALIPSNIGVRSSITTHIEAASVAYIKLVRKHELIL
jgi:hypothetical protein